jgi:branched-chain amino acid transport system substrate-binding protein
MTNTISRRRLLRYAGGLPLIIGGAWYFQSRKPGPIYVGVIGSESGSAEPLGKSLKHGVQLAEREMKNLPDGSKVKVKYRDNKSQEGEARALAELLITDPDEPVVAIISELASKRTKMAAEVAHHHGIPLITPGSTNPRITEIGPEIFRVCFIDTFQGQVMAQFVAEDLGIKRAAILIDDDSLYSIDLAGFFADEFKKRAGAAIDPSAKVHYHEGDTDFAPHIDEIVRIKAMSSEKLGVFIPGYSKEAALIAIELRNRKQLHDVDLLGADGWGSPDVVTIGGNAVNGAYYTDHCWMEDPHNAPLQEFITQYRKNREWGGDPDAYAALSYDAATLLFDAIGRASSRVPAEIRDAIATTRDFMGVTGKINFDSNRDAKRPAVIMKIETGGKRTHVKTVNPAQA